LDDPSLTADCLQEIFDQTGGIPRKINVLCSRLFLLGELEELHELDREHVTIVAEDLAQETAAFSEPPDEPDPGKCAVTPSASSSTKLPVTSPQTNQLPIRTGDTASELAYLRHRVESLENQARLDKEKIIRFVADQLKSLSENLNKLEG